MIRKLFIATAFTILSCFMGAYAAESADTLLNAASAASISINSEGSYTSITVKGVNGTADNFYYQSHSKRQKQKGVTETSIICPDITDICVTNSDERVTISYITADGNVQHYAFGFGDPDNRSFKSFIGEGGNDFGLTIKRSSYLQWDVICGGIMLGWMTPLNSTPSLGTSMGRNLEFGIANLVAVRMRHGANSLSLGMGFQWQDYVRKGDYYFSRDDNGLVTFEPYPEGSTKHRSRIGVYSMQFPLLYTFSFGHNRNFTLQCGPIMNVATGGGIKTEYKLDGRRYTVDTEKRLGRPVTVDLMGAIYFQSVGIYCRYSPMKKLKASTGIDFNTFSTGLIIGI